MKKPSRLIGLILCFAAAAALLCGCSSKSSNGYYYTDGASDSQEAIAEYTSDKSAVSGEDGVISESSSPIPATHAPDGTKIIYSAQVDIETLKFDEARAHIQQMTESSGGFLQSSEVSGIASYRTWAVTIRIPSEKYQDFLHGLSEDSSMQIQRQSETADDISENYYDTQNRLKSKQAELEALQEMYKQAVNMEDLITIRQAINDTQYEIDELSGTLQHYDSLLSYSTITLNLQEVSRLSGTETPQESFGSRFLSALQEGTQNMIDGCQDFAIWFASHWFGILIFIAIVVVIVCLAKRHHRAKKASLQQNMPGGGKMPMNGPVYTVSSPVPPAPIPPEAPQPGTEERKPEEK